MPKEGAAFFQDNFAVPHDAPNPENALIFINFMMDPKNIAEASNFTGYTNTIAGSEKYMKGLLAEDQARGLTPESHQSSPLRRAMLGARARHHGSGLGPALAAHREVRRGTKQTQSLRPWRL